MGAPVTPAMLLWLVAGRLSAPVAGQPLAGAGQGREVGGAALASVPGPGCGEGLLHVPGLQAVLHSLVARPQLRSPLPDKTHLSENGL